MKGLEYILVVAGVLTVWYLASKSKETFVQEFVDKSNDQRTAETSASSYEQRTNHFIPTKPLLEPITGVETPFRVNQWTSFQPN
jgi:hypothetical protein